MDRLRARYPGMKHSGKQISAAPFDAAPAIASSAAATDCAGEAGYLRLASAILNIVVIGSGARIVTVS